MTDQSPTRDDEIVSAVLDGEATPAEVARVEADPALRSRLAEIGAIRELVGAPVVPLDEVSQKRLLSTALDSANPNPTHRPAPLRDGLPWWRRSTSWGIGSAAVVVALAMLVIPSLVDGWGEQTDEASVATDSATADEHLETQDAGTFADEPNDADHEADQDHPPDALDGLEPGGASAGSDGAGEGADPTTTTSPALDVRVYPDVASFRDEIARSGAILAREQPATTGYQHAPSGPLVELRDSCGSLVSDHIELAPVLEAEGWVDGARLVAIATRDAGGTDVTVTVFDPVQCTIVVDD